MASWSRRFVVALGVWWCAVACLVACGVSGTPPPQPPTPVARQANPLVGWRDLPGSFRTAQDKRKQEQLAAQSPYETEQFNAAWSSLPAVVPGSSTSSGFQVTFAVATPQTRAVSCMALLSSVTTAMPTNDDFVFRSYCPASRDNAPARVLAVSEQTRNITLDDVLSPLTIDFCHLPASSRYNVYCTYQDAQGNMPHPELMLTTRMSGIPTRDDTPPAFVGNVFTYKKPSFAFPPPQDCVSAKVCIARNSASVLYNTRSEDYPMVPQCPAPSPEGTLWAPGRCSLYAGDMKGEKASAKFVSFGAAMKPACTFTGVANSDMCMLLLEDESYFDIHFRTWNDRQSGGEVEYTRRAYPVPADGAKPAVLATTDSGFKLELQLTERAHVRCVARAHAVVLTIDEAPKPASRKGIDTPPPLDILAADVPSNYTIDGQPLIDGALVFTDLVQSRGPEPVVDFTGLWSDTIYMIWCDGRDTNGNRMTPDSIKGSAKELRTKALPRKVLPEPLKQLRSVARKNESGLGLAMGYGSRLTFEMTIASSEAALALKADELTAPLTFLNSIVAPALDYPPERVQVRTQSAYLHEASPINNTHHRRLWNVDLLLLPAKSGAPKTMDNAFKKGQQAIATRLHDDWSLTAGRWPDADDELDAHFRLIDMDFEPVLFIHCTTGFVPIDECPAALRDHPSTAEVLAANASNSGAVLKYSLLGVLGVALVVLVACGVRCAMARCGRGDYRPVDTAGYGDGADVWDQKSAADEQRARTKWSNDGL